MQGSSQTPYLWLDMWFGLAETGVNGSHYILPPEQYVSIGAARFIRVRYEVTTFATVAGSAPNLDIELQTSNQPYAANATFATVVSPPVPTPWSVINTQTVVTQFSSVAFDDDISTDLEGHLRLHFENKAAAPSIVNIRAWISCTT